MKNQGFILSTLLLTIVNVLVRILGFLYRIILVRLIGAEGLGLFELVNPIIMLIFTLVGSGVPVAVIRLTSQAVARERESDGFKAVEYILFVMIGISLLFWIGLVVLTPLISKNILGDSRLSTPLYIFGPTILFASLAAVFRGYFYGTKNVIPPALSQLTEQFIRMSIVFALLKLLYPINPIMAVSVSMTGTVIGEMMGMSLLAFLFNKTKNNGPPASKTSKLSFRKTLGSFFTIAMPITVSRIVNSILRVITSIIIPVRLMVSGLDKSTALSYFGKVNGMAMPLLFLPFTFTSALVMNLVPRISESMEKSNGSLLHYYIDKALHIAFVVAIPVCGMFLVFSDEIFLLLYDEGSGIYLAQLSIVVLFLCLYQITSSIMQGMGKEFISTIFYVGGMFLQLVLTYILVAQPDYQITGYILSTIISFFIISFLNFSYVLYYTKTKFKFSKWVITPTFATLCSLIFAIFSGQLLESYLNKSLSVLLSLIFMVIIYLGILYFTKNLRDIFKKVDEKR